MGLFGKRKRRATRRAEAKALKHKASLEAKLSAKNERKRDRFEAQNQRKVTKAQVAALQAEEKAALKAASKAERELFSPAQMRKYIAVARVVIPIVAPLIYRGATYIRGYIDTRRAHKLGIDVQQLGDFTGHGAHLQARIANTDAALSKIDPGKPTGKKSAATPEHEFVIATRTRLDALSTAVRTVEQMPHPQRRSAHQSISTELSTIESEVLARLGVS
jgi:uncharacterized protein DUF6474